MSESSYFVCAAVKVKDDRGNVIRTDLLDTIAPGPWAIRSLDQYENFKTSVAELLKVNASDMVIINLSLLYQSL